MIYNCNLPTIRELYLTRNIPWVWLKSCKLRSMNIDIIGHSLVHRECFYMFNPKFLVKLCFSLKDGNQRKRGRRWSIFKNYFSIFLFLVWMQKLIESKYNKKWSLGCRCSSEDSFVPSILLPRVWIPSTPSKLLSIYF